MSDVKGIEISNIFGLEEPLTKLIECVGEGIGKMYEPTHIKRMAKAKQEEIKLIGEALTENINLPSKYENGKVSFDITSADELLKRTGNRVLFSEMRKQQNIESIIAETYNQLEKEESVTDEPVSQDWLFQFFDNAGDISDENMQKIWSRILAGEIIKPNTYTLRTLTTLKNITSNEAKLFQEVAPFVIANMKYNYIYADNELLEKYDFTYGKLMVLEDCGLINLNGFVSLDFQSDENIICCNTLILIIKGKIRFKIYSLTESGKQIFNLVKNEIKSNEEYFLDICNSVKNENPKIPINAYKIIKINDTSIEYDDKKDLLQNN